MEAEFDKILTELENREFDPEAQAYIEDRKKEIMLQVESLAQSARGLRYEIGKNYALKELKNRLVNITKDIIEDRAKYDELQEIIKKIQKLKVEYFSIQGVAESFKK